MKEAWFMDESCLFLLNKKKQGLKIEDFVDTW